ncbi:MAG: hypothetical protein LUH05_05130 [Candidatus Gastranaerophilales bacterium]|nr:hypothetical protein [Candidatus Gastranaerophilales bacterium]
MILKEFSKYLQKNKDKNSVNLLNEWIIERITRPSLDKVDNILKAELYYAKNNNGKTLIIAKSDTGRTLLNALYNFSLSFEQYKLAKFLHDKKANDFKKNK